MTANSLLPNTYISAAKCATPDPEEGQYFDALKTKQEQIYEDLSNCNMDAKILCSLEYCALRCSTKTASVYQVKYNERYYALKALRKYKISKSDSCKYVKSERDILESFRKNPFIIRLHATMQDSQRVYFLLTYAPCGSLYQYLTKYKLDEESVKWFSGQIICAINCLHSKSITLGKALKRALHSLPKDTNKRMMVVQHLAQNLNIISKTVRQHTRKQHSLSIELKKLVIQFYQRDDITYQLPGKRDYATVTDDNGESM
ncbi:unnamed protein product, partial [Rotaria magnacalcarata]